MRPTNRADARLPRICSLLLGSIVLFGPVMRGSAQVQAALPLRAGLPVTYSTGGAGVASSGSGKAFEGGTGAASYAADSSQRVVILRNMKAFSAVGVGVHLGLNGIGFDIATPLSGKFNVRAGGDFFSYSDTFQTDGTNVTADLHLMSGHAALDWFPFGGRFRLSPGVTLANNNRVRANAVLPPGTDVTLGGTSFTSSPTDPLNGSGSIDFRKTAPGLTVGFGNLVPRHGGHFSFPFDLGFIYVGQPRLKVNFAGTACDPGVPSASACQSVDQNAEFQSSLATFRARLNKDLDYAQFYPILSMGVGYSF